MMSRKLPEVCEIQYGFPFDSSLFSAEGDLPLIRIRDVVRGYTETYTSEKCDVAYLVHEGDILVGMDGVFNVAKWKGEPAYLNQRVCRIIPNETIDADFLFYFIPTALKKIENETAFVTVKHLKAKQLNAVVVPDVPIEEQKKIAAQLNVITHLISLRQQQAEKLDELVKARFVEMFGDPISNPHAFARVPLSELAEIKIGPFGSLLHKEDYVHGEHPLINPSHIINGKIVIDENFTVSDEKYIELEAYHLRPGDVVLGRRGEMGRCAVVEREGYLCGTGSLLIRTNGQVTADYIQKTISFPAYKRMIEDMAVGQTMQNLNVPIVSKFPIVKPPLDVQKRYYHFVQEIDCEKERIQKSAALLETLKRSLMQQYFG